MTTQVGRLKVYSVADVLNLPLPKSRGRCLIETDRTPVECHAEPLGEVWWRGKQWAVTSYGIECLDGSYSFEAARLPEDLPGYSWPQHMSEKDWVDADDFATAWLVALALHGVPAKHRARVKPEALREAIAGMTVLPPDGA